MTPAKRAQRDEHIDYRNPFSIIGAALHWLFRQEAIVVFLAIQTSSISYFVWHVLEKDIPAHTERIQQGYERVAEQHHGEVEKLSESFKLQYATMANALQEARRQDREIFVQMLRELQGTRSTVEEAVAPIKEATRPNTEPDE